MRIWSRGSPRGPVALGGPRRPCRRGFLHVGWQGDMQSILSERKSKTVSWLWASGLLSSVARRQGDKGFSLLWQHPISFDMLHSVSVSRYSFNTLLISNLSHWWFKSVCLGAGEIQQGLKHLPYCEHNSEFWTQYHQHSPWAQSLAWHLNTVDCSTPYKKSWASMYMWICLFYYWYFVLFHCSWKSH